MLKVVRLKDVVHQVIVLVKLSLRKVLGQHNQKQLYQLACVAVLFLALGATHVGDLVEKACDDAVELRVIMLCNQTARDEVVSFKLALMDSSTFLVV